MICLDARGAKVGAIWEVGARTPAPLDFPDPSERIDFERVFVVAAGQPLAPSARRRRLRAAAAHAGGRRQIGLPVAGAQNT